MTNAGTSTQSPNAADQTPRHTGASANQRLMRITEDAMPGSLHPLISWWRKHSGWSHGNDSPREAVSEGKLCEDTWNAAIDAAASCVVEDGNPMVALERIKRLRYEPANV